MKSTDHVGVTFVNTVLNRGIFNGVVNLSLGVLQFTPSDDGTTVDPDPVIAARLRMDKICARQIRDALSELLEMIDKAEHEAVEHSINGAAVSQTEGKPN